jgi:Flp pilus assembly protein TadG
MALNRLLVMRTRVSVLPITMTTFLPSETQTPADRAGGPLRRGEKGAEQIEFALAVSVLMTLLLGIVVFAQGYHVYQSITRAAREGVRMAVMPTAYNLGSTYMDGSNISKASSSTVFNAYIAPVLQSANLNPNLVSNYDEKVAWLNQGSTDQQCGVIISFAYPYQFNIPFTTLRLTTISIPTQVQMRLEDQPASGSATCKTP